LRIRWSGNEHPTKASVFQELFKNQDPNEPEEITVANLRAEAEAIYAAPIANLVYSIDEVKCLAQFQSVHAAYLTSINAWQDGKVAEAVRILSDAYSKQFECPRLAGPSFYHDSPNQAPIVIPGILRRGFTGILSSSSKAYKSWNSIWGSCACGLGLNWMGFGQCPVNRVLHVNLELEEEEFKVRIDMVTKELGVTRAQLEGKVDFLNLFGFPTDLDTVLSNIRNSYEPAKSWGLILIDPIYPLYVTEGSSAKGNIENDNAAIGRMFLNLRKLAWKLKAAIFLIHHFKKGGASELENVDSGVGAGTFGRIPEAVLSLKEVDPPFDEPDTRAWKLSSDVRYFPYQEPWGLKLGQGDQFPLLIPDERIDISKLKTPNKPGRKKKVVVEDVLGLIPQTGFVYSSWKLSAKNELDIAERPFLELKNEAIDSGYVEFEGDRKNPETVFRLSDSGRIAVTKYREIERTKARINEFNKSYRRTKGGPIPVTPERPTNGDAEPWNRFRKEGGESSERY
jgi:hypothetical protein